MNVYGYDMQAKLYDSRFVNLNGEPIERTPISHPYCYDEYAIWKDENFNEEICSAVYSDRLFLWDYEKFNKCCQEIFKNQGQLFYEREPKEIEKFLSIYFEKQIKLTAIIQGCNQSCGYPYWVFFYE